MASSQLLNTIGASPAVVASGGILTSSANGGLQSTDYRPGASDQGFALFHTTGGAYTIRNLVSAGTLTPQEWETDFTIPAWTAGQTYYQNDLVQYGGLAYRFLPVGPQQDSLGPPPTANWAVLNAASSPAGPVLRSNAYVSPLKASLGGQYPSTLSLNVQGGPDPSVIITGTSLDGITATDHVLRSRGYVSCEGLEIFNSKYGANPSIGSSALAAGQATINTTASDPQSFIFLQRTRPIGAGAAVGFLSVVQKTANSFNVASLDATGALVNTDTSTFDWWVVNPKW